MDSFLPALLCACLVWAGVLVKMALSEHHKR